MFRSFGGVSEHSSTPNAFFKNRVTLKVSGKIKRYKFQPMYYNFMRLEALEILSGLTGKWINTAGITVLINAIIPAPEFS